MLVLPSVSLVLVVLKQLEITLANCVLPALSLPRKSNVMCVLPGLFLVRDNVSVPTVVLVCSLQIITQAANHVLPERFQVVEDNAANVLPGTSLQMRVH